MAFCASGDLSQHIRRAASSKTRDTERYPAPKEGGLHEKVVRCFLGQLAEALKFLRDKDIIHRDIKPQNLLLHPASAEDIAAGHPEGVPLLQVADFGFARALPATSLAETLCGSPLYMAPEILRYQKYDAKADLWSVGAVLYECCTGKPPFRAQNHVELLRRIERGQDRIKWPEDKKEDQPGREPVLTPRPIPNDIKELANGLLRQNPVERMSFQEFFARADEVARWGEGSLVAPGTIDEQSSRQNKPSSRTHSRQASSSNVAQLARDPVSRRDHSTVASPATSQHTAAAAFPSPIPSTAAEQEPAFTRPAPSLPVPSTRTSGSATPAEAAQAPPPVPRRGFAPKYIVGNDREDEAAAQRETVQFKTRDFAVVTTAPTPVFNRPSPIQAQSSHASSRRNSTADVGHNREAEPVAVPQPKSGIALALPSNLTATRQTQSRNQQDLAVSGMTGGDDSVLGREYVVVEKRNVEVNALADGKAELAQVRTRQVIAEGLSAELAAQTRRNSAITRRNSRGLLSRQPSSYIPTSPIAIGGTEHPGGVSPSPPGGSMPYPPVAGAHSQGAVSEPPPLARAATHTYGSSPRPRANTSTTYYSYSSSPGRYGGMAAAAPAATATAALAIVGSGSQAIAKALNMASLKLFGSPSENIWLRKRSHRKPIERNYANNALVPIAEENLMDTIEDIAQKATVIFDFADSKVILMTNLMAASAERARTPQGGNAAINVSQTNPFFVDALPKARRSSSSSSTERPVVSPLGHLASTSPVPGQTGSHTPLKSSASSKPELLPGETLVLYLKALAFLQKGIEMAREYVGGLPAGQTASAELNECKCLN